MRAAIAVGAALASLVLIAAWACVAVASYDDPSGWED